MSASSTVGQDEEDLIMFYNTVYLPLVQEVTVRFSVKKTGLEYNLPPPLPLATI